MLIIYDNPILRVKSADVLLNGDVEEIKKEMEIIMDSKRGIGIAAPQIGINQKLFYVNGGGVYKRLMINPIVEPFGNFTSVIEGCLSIPGINESILRHDKVKVTYFNHKWEKIEEEYDGLPARIIQHENDHLNGVLFIDHLPKRIVKKLSEKLEEIAKSANEEKTA